MKTAYFVIALFFFSNLLFAQSGGVPQAMKYQSVARDKFGIELKFKKVYLQISLSSKKYGQPLVYYVETQEAITNELGLFNVSIGEGKVVSGVFINVPWFTDDIWMDVDTKDEDWKPYVKISSSRLLTVPYAFHANSASHIMGVADGNFSNIWSLKGNRNINQQTDFLGNLDSLDLNLITNNQTRLTLFANGLVYLPGSLHIGKNLDVDGTTKLKGDVYLNTNAGNTYVKSTTQSTAPNNGALVVLGGVGVGRNLNVGQAFTVIDTANLFSPAQSYNKSTGALVVAGGVGIGKTLNVGSALKVADSTSLNSAAQSYNISTGALVVAGGVGIGKTLNVGQHLMVEDTAVFNGDKNSYTPNTGTVVVNGGVGIKQNLNVGASVTIGDTLLILSDKESYNPTTGALVIKGGVGIGKRLNVQGATNINDSFSVTSNRNYVASFTNTTNANGISIQIGNAVPALANQFVTFLNSNGDAVGSIEGETLNELLTKDADYQSNLNDQNITVAFGAIALASASFQLAADVTDQIGADASTTLCVGLGVCETVPVPSLIVATAINLALSVANVVTTASGVAVAAIQRQHFIDESAANVGVTYQSGSGDYAEWLPKLLDSEKFLPGDVIGVIDGAITLNTNNATQLLVISHKPIVLGNMPAGNNKTLFEKVAFMGQVPVKVYGKVNLGDYILPDNLNDGGGKAIAPLNMKPADYKNIIGIAWSASKNDIFNYINVAVGLNGNATAKVISDQADEIKKMSGEIEQIKITLAKMAGNTSATLQQTNVQNTSANNIVNSLPQVLYSKVPLSAGKLTPSIALTKTDNSRIQFYQLSEDQIDDVWIKAQKQFIESGGDLNNTFWSKYNSDSSYKNLIKKLYKDKINNALIEQKIVNRQYSQNIK